MAAFDVKHIVSTGINSQRFIFRCPGKPVMSVGLHSVEKLETATTTQDEVTYDKDSGRFSPTDTPLVSQLHEERRPTTAFWRRMAKQDLDAIATRPSVFDDPVTLELEYRPATKL